MSNYPYFNLVTYLNIKAFLEKTNSLGQFKVFYNSLLIWSNLKIFSKLGGSININTFFSVLIDMYIYVFSRP